MKALFLARKFEDGDSVSEYIKSLAEYLVEKNHQATIIAFDNDQNYSVDERVNVERVSMFYEGDSLYSWAMMLNNELKKKAREYINQENVDIIHANDWMTVPAATAIKQKYETKMMLTIHSTENERGFNDPNSQVISELEWKGSTHSEKIFVNTQDTYNSVSHDLDISENKVEKINPLTENWQPRILEHYKEMENEEKMNSKKKNTKQVKAGAETK